MISIYHWLLRVLETEYEDVRLLKQSCRSSIRLIRHKVTGRRFVRREFTGNSDVYQKLVGCTCSNLPIVYEAVSQGEQNLILEEYVAGDTLGSLLRGALFSQEETRDIVLQVCRALWVLHSMDAVHRDVKPENVILRGREAVLIDFDAARVYKPEAEEDTQVLGTTGFAAPEQYGLCQSDSRADLYSVGILINVMLTGEHPSRRLAPGRMGRIVERCTRVNPEKRYQNALRLMEAL